MRTELARAKTLVIKIGSSLLLRDKCLDQSWLAAMAEDIAAAHRAGQRVIIVTSGSVSLGRDTLGLVRQQLSLPQSQAAAAVGQIELARGWQASLARHDIATAQILLTPEDTEQRRRYLNARQTLNALLDIGAVPVINENDTVATQELRYGDNDRLAARVAAMISADCLLLLSDIDGLYSADPTLDKNAAFFDFVDTVTPQIEAMAGGSGSTHGSGGMVTKLQAAQIAQSAGCHMVLASGKMHRPIQALANGARSTVFRAHDNPLKARASWIAGTLQPAGRVYIDGGAARALGAGKSLLPVGVTAIEGSFERGDCIALLGADGVEIGRGLSGFASAEAHLMMGKSSAQAADVLGYEGRNEMVHRDDMVLTNAPNGTNDATNDATNDGTNDKGPRGDDNG